MPSVPHPPVQVTGCAANQGGTLLSPSGAPSVMSTTAFTWHETHSGFVPSVGGVNPPAPVLSHCVPLPWVPPPQAADQLLSEPAKNWPTLKSVSASGVAWI